MHRSHSARAALRHVFAASCALALAGCHAGHARPRAGAGRRAAPAAEGPGPREAAAIHRRTAAPMAASPKRSPRRRGGRCPRPDPRRTRRASARRAAARVGEGALMDIDEGPGHGLRPGRRRPRPSRPAARKQRVAAPQALRPRSRPRLAAGAAAVGRLQHRGLRAHRRQPVRAGRATARSRRSRSTSTRRRTPTCAASCASGAAAAEGRGAHRGAGQLLPLRLPGADAATSRFARAHRGRDRAVEPAPPAGAHRPAGRARSTQRDAAARATWCS